MSHLIELNGTTHIRPDGTNTSVNITSGSTIIDNNVSTVVRFNGTNALSISDSISLNASDSISLTASDSISLTTAPDKNITFNTSGTGQVVIPSLQITGMGSSIIAVTQDGTPVSTGITIDPNISTSLMIMAAAQGDGLNATNTAGVYSLVKLKDVPMSINRISQFDGLFSDHFDFIIDGSNELNIFLAMPVPVTNAPVPVKFTWCG